MLAQALLRTTPRDGFFATISDSMRRACRTADGYWLGGLA